MATSAAQDAAVRERIIKHMNNDHQDSIQRYLEHHENAGFYEIRNAQLTDINLNELKISYAGKQAIIPFDPPMTSLSQARERVVQMDKDALVALDRSDIRIATFAPCYVHPCHLINFTLCFLTYAVFFRSGNVKPGSLLYDNLLFFFPGFARFCQVIQPWLFSIMVAIHTFEARLMVRKVRKHGLTPLQGIWWQWVGTSFVEGITSFKRLDKLIAEKQKEKETKKH